MCLKLYHSVCPNEFFYAIRSTINILYLDGGGVRVPLCLSCALYARAPAFETENSKLFIFLVAINSWNCVIALAHSHFQLNSKANPVHSINTTQHNTSPIAYTRTAAFIIWTHSLIHSVIHSFRPWFTLPLLLLILFYYWWWIFRRCPMFVLFTIHSQIWLSLIDSFWTCDFWLILTEPNGWINQIIITLCDQLFIMLINMIPLIGFCFTIWMANGSCDWDK